MDQPPAQQPESPPTPPAAPEPSPAQPPQPAPWATPPDVSGPAPGIQFAPHGGRLIAYIVDVIIASVLVLAIMIVLIIIAAALAVAGFAGLGALAVFALVVVTFLVSLGYFPWFWANGGQTPGMRLFHLRVVRDRDGGPVGWGQAILRLIGYWIDGVVFYIGFIWIFVDSRRRGWHDLIAGTVVIEERT